MRSFVLAILITLATSIARKAAAQGIAVRGTVRAADTGEPLLGAVVRAGGDSTSRLATGAGQSVGDGKVGTGSSAAWSDSAGVYALWLTAAPQYKLRITRMGYAARDLVILPGRDSVVRLDVYLAPQAAELAQVSVLDTRDPGAGGVESAPGSVMLTGADLRRNPALTGGAGDADALHALAMTPAVGALPDGPDPFRVRGGSSDQNLILLDDVPILNPFHAGGMVAAVNPDIVSRVALHAGVPSARFGNGASSTIELRTVQDSSSRLIGRGYVDAGSVRQMIRGPLGPPEWGGTMTVAVRTSTGAAMANPGGNQDGGGGENRRDFSDAFASVALPLARGTLETFGLFARNRYGFDARLDGEGGVGGGIPAASEPITGAPGAPVGATDPVGRVGATGEGDAAVSAESPAPRNAFVWSTQTQAIVWRRRPDRLAARPGILLRAWRSASTDAAAWASAVAGGAGGPLALSSAFVNSGVGARVAWGAHSLRWLAGGDLERDRSRYAVARSALEPVAGASLYALTGARVAAPVFIEMRRAWGEDRWTLSTGLRTDVAAAGWLAPQPRLWIRYQPARWLGISAGYARTQQRAQALRNEESLVDAITAAGLLSVARAGSVQILRADQVTGTADIRIGAETRLLADAYARRMNGLALVPAATAQPFAPAAPPVGGGRAAGVTLSLVHRGQRLSVDAGFRSTKVVRTFGGTRYRPWFQPSRSFMLAGAYRVGGATWLRLAAWSASGRSATGALGGIEWNAGATGLLGGDVLPDIAGTPEQFATALGGVNLSSYQRVDVGLRHAWRTSRLSPAGLTLDAGVVNVFGRRNALGAFAPYAGGALQSVPMQPRALQIGLGWRF